MPQRSSQTSIDAIASAHRAAQSAWPNVVVSIRTFAEYIAARLPGVDDGSAVAAMHTTDLYLACACAHRDELAVADFEQHFLSNAGQFVAHLRQPPELVDELKQRVRERLFIATPDALPKIAEYSGRGALGGWLRLVVVRGALSMLRAIRDDLGLDDAELPLLGADPEMDLLKARYRDEFRAAFEAALRSLTPAQRNILRLHHVDGLTIDQLAALCHQHRSTVARQINAARDRILTGARERLGHATGLGRTEVDSLIGVLRSQLELSVTRILQMG